MNMLLLIIIFLLLPLMKYMMMMDKIMLLGENAKMREKIMTETKQKNDSTYCLISIVK